MARVIKKLLHQLFEISVILKGVYGLTEIVLGTIILFFNRHIVTHFLLYFVQGELNENPRNWIANHLLQLSSHITTSSELFMASYFLVYGVIKLVLVYGLLKEEEWSFPTAIGFMTLFGVYEIYRFTHTHSVVLLFLIVLDFITIYLVWHEWKTRIEAVKPA